MLQIQQKSTFDFSHLTQTINQLGRRYPCEPMLHNDCQECTDITTITSQCVQQCTDVTTITSQCVQQCTTTGARCKLRAIDPDTVPYGMQYISTLVVRPDRWPATRLDALRRAFVPCLKICCTRCGLYITVQ